MNLIKLFNTAYLKENIKKSKGFILLFLILVPIFTALVMILEVNSRGRVNVPDFGELTIINIIGMYVIPFVLSFSLFGYVYKRNSVDFINSMPLNRKNIFITNTIGGIILITLMQFLTALILVICDAIFGNVIIFTKMISDIFILMWVSYVFVFIATNLAMTVSGTFLTQVAITLLILFLVPFCIDGYNGFSIRENYSLINGSDEFVNTVYEEISYTFPYRLISMLITGTTEEFFSVSSIIRMVLLGILYFGIGIYLFQKRKMENTEESFSNIKIHIFVKALTILPMIIFLNLIRADIEFVIFAIALISVYYFVFDFVVKRKVALKVSILSLIAILIITQGICMGTNAIKENLPAKRIDKEDIEAISVGYCRSYSGGSWYYYRDMFSEIEYYFENKEVIDLIFESADYVEEMYSIPEDIKIYGETEEITVTKEEIIKSETAEQKSVIIDKYSDYEPTASVSVFFKMRNGRKLKADIEILESDFDKIMEIFEKEETFANIIKQRFINTGVTTLENLIVCDEETEEIIKKEIKNKLDTMPLSEIYKTLRTTQDAGVYQYYYNNHKLISNTISITITDELFKLASEMLNKKAVEVIAEAKKEDVYSHFYLEIPEGNNNKFSGYIDFEDDVIYEFILNNADEKFDITKDYYMIRGNISNYGTSIYFYTNKIDVINSIIKEREKFFFDEKTEYIG